MPDGQPPITPDTGIISTDWLPGPSDGTVSSVVVSFTDFRATSNTDLTEIFQTGLELAKSWPIMSGAVGLWLWGKPAELRGGSVAVWRTAADLERFFRWKAHQDIVRAWRHRIGVLSETWVDQTFDAEQAWLRAEQYMRVSPESSAPPDGSQTVTAP